MDDEDRIHVDLVGQAALAVRRRADQEGISPKQVVANSLAAHGAISEELWKGRDIFSRDPITGAERLITVPSQIPRVDSRPKFYKWLHDRPLLEFVMFTMTWVVIILMSTAFYYIIFDERGFDTALSVIVTVAYVNYAITAGFVGLVLVVPRLYQYLTSKKEEPSP